MKYIVGNWKMNLNVPESAACFLRVRELVRAQNDDLGDGATVVICPTFLALQTLNIENDSEIRLGAQNCNAQDSGALTGEVSAVMLKGIADYVLVGHSERRQNFHETDADVNEKLLACLRHNLRPIVCVGETLRQRKAGQTDTVLRNQLDGALQGVRASEANKIIVAYEPIWAISTVSNGEIPSPNDLAQAIQTIKSQLGFMFGDKNAIPVLYGGSVDDQNAAEILKIEAVEGFLVGGASLNPQKFATIVKIARRSGKEL
ncbi:MAG: triose-phosphate isomerase [Candidatus Nomurabacteria bacterium]|jgi:triosephosphate isomerase|nr:triose-phosphate isomerase [Candidatus Nomurabacteria bacterium]